jgi:DNA-binding SARP family transcriptional activator
VTLDGQPVTDFKSNKVWALLAYLAVEADRLQGREVLAGLLWPDWPDRDALSNLRYSLSNLRRVIGDRTAVPPNLLVTRDTLQFDTNSDYWLDVTDFLAQTEPILGIAGGDHVLRCVEEAILLYRGDFLEGFSIKDSFAFEEWMLTKRQQINQRLLSALRYLVTTYEQRGQYEQAQAWARRQIELEPWDEAAHQQLMRILAQSGQRTAALVQYETCCQLLAEELGVEPAQETTWLYKQIRDGELKARVPIPTRPLDLPSNLPFS